MSNYQELLENYRNIILEEVYSQILTEANLQTIKSNPSFNHNLSNEELDSLVDYDPFLYKAENKDTFNSPCIQWLVNKNQDIKKEEPSKIREVLEKFFNYAKTGKIKNINPNFIKQPNDINQYKMLKGVEQAVEETEKDLPQEEFDNLKNFDFDNVSSNVRENWAIEIYKRLYNKQGEQINSLETFGLENDLKKVYSGQTVDIFQPLTWKGSVVLRCGSNMAVCIGQSTEDKYYKQYINAGDLLYIINKDDVYNNYAISIPWKLAKKAKDEGRTFKGKTYDELRKNSIFYGPEETPFFEIENKHDKYIIPCNFFFDVKPEVLEFLKQDKEWFEKLDLCMDVITTKKDCEKYILNKKLLYACYNNRLQEIKILLDKGASIKFKDKYGRTSLMYACEKGNKEIVELLLNKKVNIEVKDGYKTTPLMFACENGNKEIVELLLNKGANIEAKNKNCDTSLILACEYGNKEVAELLLNKGANIEAKNESDKTPLIYACEKGNKEVVELLLNRGANIKVKDEYDNTPLMLACEKGNKEVVELLLNKGANIEYKNNRDETPLIIACQNDDNLELVKFLLDRGANIETKNIHHETPLIVACIFRNKEIIELLLNKGANIETNSPLTKACEYKGNKEIVELLLDRGANIETKDGDYKTPLIYACENGDKEVVELLLNRGANIEYKNNRDETPLIIAFKYRREETIKLLLERGADVNVVNKYGETLLQVATENRWWDIVDLLKQHGAKE